MHSLIVQCGFFECDARQQYQEVKAQGIAVDTLRCRDLVEFPFNGGFRVGMVSSFYGSGLGVIVRFEDVALPFSVYEIRKVKA